MNTRRERVRHRRREAAVARQIGGGVVGKMGELGTEKIPIDSTDAEPMNVAVIPAPAPR
jgi:hypothetical protein